MILRLQNECNSLLDALVRPGIRIGHKTWSAYLGCVNSGVLVGTIVLYFLAFESRLSLGVLTGIVLLVAALSWLLFRSTSILGRSTPMLRWAKKGVYHFQIVALACTVGLLRLLGEPILAYLDVLVSGMLVYQAFGRFGCLMAGCCHGKPHSWGVRYGERHAATGYPFFTGAVRLFPLQLIEAIWLLLLLAVTGQRTLSHASPGESLSWYIVGYGAGRFLFEFMRGDTGRVYLHQFSEPQWTALLLSSVVAALEWAGVLPLHWVHTAVPFGMALSIVYLLLKDRGGRLTSRRLMRPDHVLEVFQTVSWIHRHAGAWTTSGQPSFRGDCLSGVTSLGVHISGRLALNGQLQEYWLWSATGHLHRTPARVLARLIIRLLPPVADWDLSECGQGVHRLRIRPRLAASQLFPYLPIGNSSD
jgi:prolipoprotein diacylglyceryltransferase